MADLLATQIDFIIFFNGLSWVLCGLIALSLARTGRPNWWIFGAFGLLRGLSCWLDLAAMTVGDSEVFATFRVAALASAFLLLLEFARRECRSIGLRPPGPWIHIAVVAPVLAAWWMDGSALAVVLTRYLIALPAAVATGVALFQRNRKLGGGRRWITATSLAAFLLYAFGCGVVVPPTNFFPGSVLNEATFQHATGLPIELVRGLAACLQAIALGGLWFQKTGVDSESEIYRRFLTRSFGLIILAMTVALIGGWFLTFSLDRIYRHDIEDDSNGHFAVLTAGFAGETSELRAVIALLARDPDLLDAIDRPEDRENAATAALLVSNAILAVQGRMGMILDARGRTVAVQNAPLGEDDDVEFAESPAFREAMDKGNAMLIHYDPENDLIELYAAAAILRPDGRPAGLLVLQRTLTRFTGNFEHFNLPYFLVDGNGVIVASNQIGVAYRPLAPLDPSRIAQLDVLYPQLVNQPLLQQPLRDLTWLTYQRKETLFRREDLGANGWSLVMAVPPAGQFASRILGIVITLLAALTSIMYLLARDRRVHDAIALQHRLQLQNVARDMENRANTDALTGIANRARFSQGLAAEIERATRYGQPVSVMIFDADHFKRVNDTFGHPAGDAVLRRIATIAREGTRTSDLVARWGGEEFVVMMPESDAGGAMLAAEKLRSAIAATQIEGVGSISCSFGVAQWVRGENGERTLARADGALYRAKANGRNRVEHAETDAAA
jgi:diguanylate cyclase (GGDEF)-like protein